MAYRVRMGGPRSHPFQVVRDDGAVFALFESVELALRVAGSENALEEDAMRWRTLSDGNGRLRYVRVGDLEENDMDTGKTITRDDGTKITGDGRFAQRQHDILLWTRDASNRARFRTADGDVDLAALRKAAEEANPR